MANDWSEATLADVCSEVRYGYTAAATKEPTGTRFLRVTDIARDFLDWESVPFCEIGAAELERHRLQAGDIVVARMGTIGVSAHVKPPVGAVCASYLIRHRILHSRADSRFVSYVLRSPGYWEFVWSHGGGGAVQPNINAKVLGSFRFKLPQLGEQRAIAHILGTLDDKIELNRRMSSTLEEIARALFKSWFVDFDPVRAKLEGRDPGLPREIADLFPDRLVESELGEIPEGWEVRLAGDLFDVAIGKTPPRKEPQWFSVDPQDVPWMSIRDLGQSSVFISRTAEFLTPEAVERFRVRRIPDGTVVLSFKLTVGRVAITDGEMLSNEAIAHFPSSEQTFLAAGYLYCYLSQFRDKALGRTSSIATAVNSDSVRAIPVLVPSQELHDSFVRFSRDAFLRLRELDRENRSIIELRDTLLPRLLSGELRVPDAERLLAAAPV
jgi:type I restriction enzyme S subunit